MSKIIDFFNNNYIKIGIIIIVVFVLLVFISVKGIDLNEPVLPTHLVQTVTVETFTPGENEDIEQLNMGITQGFCASLEGNTIQLEKSCNELTKDNCAEVGCCVYLRDGLKGKCVAGSKDGPTFKTDKDGNMITTDRYYYLDNCIGKCLPSM